MMDEHLDACHDHVFFRWFLKTKNDKNIKYFMDIGSDFSKTTLWSIFATCHSVQLRKHAFTEEFNIIGHGESPENISADDNEMDFVVSANGLNKFNSEQVDNIVTEVNRLMTKNGSFLFSMLVGNPEFEHTRENFFNADRIYEILKEKNFEVQSDIVIYPFPYLLGKETIYANTANEQTIDVYRELRNFQTITDDDHNRYTFFVPTTNLLTSLKQDEFASLIVLARKIDNVDSTDYNKLTKTQIIEEFVKIHAKAKHVDEKERQEGLKKLKRMKKADLLELLMAAKKNS